MANVAKLEAVVDYIRTHPEEHDQSAWAEKNSCGTTLCFAGTAVVLAGYRIVWVYTISAISAISARCELPGFPGRGIAPEYISDAAQRELELSENEAHELFILATSFDDVERTVKGIINESTP